MVARALAQDTPIIILDEPTTHLDLQHKISLLKLLKELAHIHKKCIFFSTHDIELAIQISDSIIVMNDKSVVQETPANLISSDTFSRLFSDNNIFFDAEKVKFIFKDI
jgi:iron complex transport system ATP-binding protein